jgi:WD40 repeat protein
MGVVYKARQIRADRLVALKMILAGVHASEAERARFRTEAQAVARLQHPHIVQIYEVGEQDGLPFFSLEYLGGGSLANRLDGTPWPALKATKLVETLARAMQAAHEKGIIHRDLKPASVLLTPDGQLKITDFGLAKRLDSAGPTQSGAIMGTPSYMAPEQAGGKGKQVGPAADVYALGAILYELLTGRPPFRAETPLDTVLQVISDEPVAPSRLNAKAPRDLETICLKCLQKEMGQRYVSARELADDLCRFEKGEPIWARPSNIWERGLKWAKRRPAISALIAVCGLAVALILAELGISNRAIANREEKTRQALDERTATLVELKMEQGKTLAAFRREADERRRAQFQLAENYLERGLALCEQGHVRSGMLWLGHSLQLTPKEPGDLQRVIRMNMSAWRSSLTTLRSTFAYQARSSPLSIALSPDATKIVTGDREIAQLWDVATGKPIGKALNHVEILQHKLVQGMPEFAVGHDVAALAFSPDGKVVLTGNGDGLARWDSNTGEPIGAPIILDYPNDTVKGRVYVGAYDSKGTSILCIYGGGYLVHRWDASTGERKGDPIKRAIEKTKWAVESTKGFAIASNLKSVLTSMGEGAWLIDTSTGKRIGEPLLHDGEPYISGAAISPDGTKAVTASGRAVRVWDAATGKPARRPLELDDFVTAVAFSPDGSSIITGCRGTVQVWDMATENPWARPSNIQRRSTLCRSAKTAGFLSRQATILQRPAFGNSLGQTTESYHPLTRDFCTRSLLAMTASGSSQRVEGLDRTTGRRRRSGTSPRAGSSVGRCSTNTLSLA